MATKSRERRAVDALHRIEVDAVRARNPEGKTRGWDARQVKAFVFDAIQANRAMWDVVPGARLGIVAAKFASIVTGLDRDSVPTAYISNLWDDMQAQAREWGMS